MPVEEYLWMGVLVLLGATVITMLFNVFSARNRRAASNDFAVMMVVFTGGWFAADLLVGMSTAVVREAVNFAYLMILLGFVVMLAGRWRWATKRARAPPSEPFREEQ